MIMFTLANGKQIVRACVYWPCIFIPICFCLYYLRDHDDAVEDDSQDVQTISETGNLNPEDLFLTLGLHVEGFLFAFVFLAHYLYYKEKIINYGNTILEDIDEEIGLMTKVTNMCCGCFMSRPAVAKTMLEYNYYILCIGLACSCFMVLIGTVTLDTNSTVHTVCAYLLFACATIHMMIFYYKIAIFVETRQSLLVMYRLCIFMIVPFNIVVMIAALITDSACSTKDCGKFLGNMYGILEILTAFFLIVYMHQFADDLEHVSLKNVLDSIPEVETTDTSGIKPQPPHSSGRPLSSSSRYEHNLSPGSAPHQKHVKLSTKSHSLKANLMDNMMSSDDLKDSTEYKHSAESKSNSVNSSIKDENRVGMKKSVSSTMLSYVPETIFVAERAPNGLLAPVSHDGKLLV